MYEWNVVRLWTFKCHKVVRQQNSGAVEDIILPYSAVYLRIHRWKNYYKKALLSQRWPRDAPYIKLIYNPNFVHAYGHYTLRGFWFWTNLSPGNFVYFCKSDVSAVQGHPRSLILVPIKSAYRVCDFLLVRKSNLGLGPMILSCTISEIWQLLCAPGPTAPTSILP